MGQGISAGDFGPSESMENAGILYVFPVSGASIKGDALMGRGEAQTQSEFSACGKCHFVSGIPTRSIVSGIPTRSVVFGFDDLPDWGKRSAENRRSHCAVLP